MFLIKIYYVCLCPVVVVKIFCVIRFIFKAIIGDNFRLWVVIWTIFCCHFLTSEDTLWYPYIPRFSVRVHTASQLPPRCTQAHRSSPGSLGLIFIRNFQQTRRSILDVAHNSDMDVYVTMDVTSGQMLCSDHCHWEKLLNDDMRFALADANYNSGITTLMIGIWVNSAILMSRKLRNEKRYQNLLTYTLTATLRRAVPSLATTLPFKCLYDCLKFSKYTCKFFGFVDTFLAVFEIESLAQVCIERLIYAMYKNKGWDIPRWHNKLFIGISLLLAALYSSLPLLGYGSYGKDFDCANCTFDMLLPATDAYKLIVILILVLKSLKPAIVMGLSLNYARWMEMTKIRQDNEDNIKFTMSICIIVMLNMVFWFPIFLVRSSLIMSQILYKSTELTWSPCFVMWAISMHWISPTVAMIGLAWYNTRLRTKMKNLLKFRSVDSDEPQPEAQDDKTQESTAQEVKTQEPKAQEVKAHDPKVKAQPAN